MVPRRGLEPPRPKGHCDLNAARLPIPPSGHGVERRVIQAKDLCGQYGIEAEDENFSVG